jgi:capsular polysaccharide biosynthesis protein
VPPLFPEHPTPPPGEERPLLPPAPLPGLFLETPREARPVLNGPPMPEPPPPPPPAPPPTLAAPYPRPVLVAPAPRVDAAPEPAPVAESIIAAAVPRLVAPPPAAPAASPTPAPAVLAPAPVGVVVAAPQPVPRLVELANLAGEAVACDRPEFRAGQVLRLTAAPAAPLAPPRPLLDGTAGFAAGWIGDWHRVARPGTERDVPCYFASDAVVSGGGQVWLDGRLVTAPDVMPKYLRQSLGIPAGGKALLDTTVLPVRVIEAPCLVLQGPAVQHYGNFIGETLFRILLAWRVMRDTGLGYRYLLDRAAPPWLLRILHDDLGIGADEIEFFSPATERVQLRQAIVAGLVHRDDGLHPATNALLDDLLDRLGPLPPDPPIRRMCLVRRGFRTPQATPGQCLNDEALVAIAEARHGFVPVFPDDLPWRQQLGLFRHAEIILGLYGTTLRNTIVSPAGTRVAAIGFMSTLQSEISALRGLRMAYLTEGFSAKGPFSVDVDAFSRFLDAACAPEALSSKAGASAAGASAAAE